MNIVNVGTIIDLLFKVILKIQVAYCLKYCHELKSKIAFKNMNCGNDERVKEYINALSFLFELYFFQFGIIIIIICISLNYLASFNNI